jgi:hypothetical protein
VGKGDSKAPETFAQMPQIHGRYQLEQTLETVTEETKILFEREY